MNRKIISFAIAFLLCVGLCSAGFAAWVISGDASAATEGSITVDTVTDERFSASASTPNAISFSYTKEAKRVAEQNAQLQATPWLTSDGGNTENLSVTITITVTKNSETAPNPTVGDITLEAVGDAYSTALESKLVAELPSTANGKITNTNISGSGKTVSFTITVTFDWGTAFGGMNPYFYYNQFAPDAKKGDIKYADLAARDLKALEGLKSSKYKLTVKINHA